MPFLPDKVPGSRVSLAIPSSLGGLKEIRPVSNGLGFGKRSKPFARNMVVSASEKSPIIDFCLLSTTKDENNRSTAS